MNFIKNNLKFSIFLVFTSIVPYLTLLYLFPLSPGHDWNYFNSLALVVKSYFLQGQLPLIDPWGCGGVDIFANPQSWIYSPFILLTFVISPYLSNLVSLIICAMVGFFGAYKLFEKSDQSLLNKILLTSLFVICPFFSLHFTEGHITFRTFYFLPWIFYFCNLSRGISQVRWLFAILAFMILDGGIYPFFYSLFIILFNFNYSLYFKKIYNKKNFLYFLATLISFIFIIGAKALPIIRLHENRMPEDELPIYSFSDIIDAFYNIFQININGLSGVILKYHEYALYIGFGLSCAFIFSIREQFKNKKYIYLFQFCFFAWMALGIGGAINPWTFVKLVPFLQQMHVQTRLLIIVYLLLLLIIAKLKPNKTKTFLLVIAFLEISFFNFNTYKKYMTDQPYQLNSSIGSLNNISSYDSYIPKPELYFKNSLSYNCYEPARNKIIKDKNLFLNTTNDTILADFNFNQIKLHSSSNMEGTFLMNFNWGDGWSSDGVVLSESKGVIRITPDEPTAAILLNYTPLYLRYSLFFYFSGVFLLSFVFGRWRDEF